MPASAIPSEGHATPPLAHVFARLALKALYVTILTAQTIVRAMNIAVEQLAAKSTRLATPAYAATGLLAQAARMLHAAPGSPAYLAMVEERATREKQMSVCCRLERTIVQLKTRMRRVLQWTVQQRNLRVQQGLQGASCNKRICEGKGGITCSGHGKCVKDSDGFDSKCECAKGFTGAQCEGTMCPADKNGLTCGGDDRGACNLETKQCECHCDIDSKDPQEMLWRRSVRKASLRCFRSQIARYVAIVVRVLSKAKVTIRLSCVNAGVVTPVKFARSLNAQ